MKIIVEGKTVSTGMTVVGWLEYLDGIPFICKRDPNCGVTWYAVKKITEYVEYRDNADCSRKKTESSER